MNPPTVLYPGDTTASLSANQMIQFGRAVSSEVSLAWYGLLEHSLLRARGAASSYVQKVPGPPTFLSAVGSVLGNSVASQ